MINPEETEKFWDIVETGLDDLPVVLAAEDPDLQALLEIRITGETDKVKPKRAELIDECDVKQLYAEIQRGYGLSSEGMKEAIEICRSRVERNAKSSIE